MPSLGLLAVLLLPQPKVPVARFATRVHHWPVLISSAGTPSAFSPETLAFGLKSVISGFCSPRFLTAGINREVNDNAFKNCLLGIIFSSKIFQDEVFCGVMLK